MIDIDEVDLGKGNTIRQFDDEKPGVCEVILPQASMPSVLFLLVARCIIVLSSLFVATLLVDVVVFDRMLRPCKMPWE